MEDGLNERMNEYTNEGTLMVILIFFFFLVENDFDLYNTKRELKY